MTSVSIPSENIATMPANVRNVDAIKEFRAALLVFIEDASLALQTLSMELQKSYEWIEHERPQYWSMQLKRGFDLVDQTRSAYNSCRMRTVAGHRPACLEEKQAMERAKRRLEHCQYQIKAVKHVANKLRQEADEFRGRLSRLLTMTEVDLPKASALLEKTIETLEQYAEISRPTTEDT